ncbi:FliO/MopB family protein [Pirellulaceae bacterium SH449]
MSSLRTFLESLFVLSASRLSAVTVACVAALVFGIPVHAQMFEDQRIRTNQSAGEPSLVRGTGRTSVGGQQTTHQDTRYDAWQHSQAESQVRSASYESQTPPASSGLPFRGQADRTDAVAPASAQSMVELKGPSKAGDGRITKPTSPWSTFFSVGFSLCIVVCLFLGVAWMAKRTMPAGSSKLPNEVIEVLGRSTIAPRQQVYVLRFGRKLLLISQQPGQTQTLSEITDEEEVIRLAGICEANSPRSSTRSFSDVLKQVATGKVETAPVRTRRTA